MKTNKKATFFLGDRDGGGDVVAILRFGIG